MISRIIIGSCILFRSLFSMKTCFVSLSAYPLFHKECPVVFGGAEVQLFNLATELAICGDTQVDFIVGDFGQKNREVIHGITIIKSVKIEEKFGIMKKVSSVFRQLRAFYFSDADIYIQRSAGIQTGLLALFCLIFGRKFVYMTAHDWDCDGSYLKENGVSGKIYGWGLRHADVVITQSDKQKADLKKHFHMESVILKSGYDFAKKSNFRKEDMILWVARINRWKQPEIFIDLAESFPERKFVMIAPVSGDECYSKEIRDRAEGVQNLEYIPGVTFQKVEEYFQKAGIFVNTSKYEGFPNTFIQSLMRGTPVLSLTVNPDGFLEKYGVGYCAGNSFQSLIDNLVLLTGDEDIYRATSRNAFEYAKKHHDIKVICEKLSSIIGLRKTEQTSTRSV